jgi:archaellum component FlaF (FlaF/FlaG flagellin family)
MPYDNDRDLLDEIKNERNSENTKASLISLFEGDKNAVFTPSTATSFVIAIISVIVVGTLWWASVNSRLDQLTNTQQELLAFYENIKNDVDVTNESVYSNLRTLEKSLNELEVTYNTDKRINDSEVQQKLLNINVQLNEISKDLNDLYQDRNDNQLYRRDLQYTIEKIRDRLGRIEDKVNGRN